METNLSNQKDETLWKKAEKRSSFKNSLVSYVIVNAILIGIWALGDRDHFWPKWVLMFWGLGLVIKYVKTYLFPGIFSAEKEYEKLKHRSN